MNRPRLKQFSIALASLSLLGDHVNAQSGWLATKPDQYADDFPDVLRDVVLCCNDLVQIGVRMPIRRSARRILRHPLVQSAFLTLSVP